MSEMIERVAKAITPLMWRESYDGLDASQREDIKSVAVMAIEAMREPTKAIEAQSWSEGFAGDLWRQMIDVALKD